MTEDTEIIMQVSKGTEKIKVPDVVGMEDNSAQSKIKSAGLKVGTVTYEYDEDVKEGKVVSQSPSDSKKVEPNTKVNLVVSKGQKPEEKVKVKNFKGRFEEELLDWASQNGLNASMQRTENSNIYEEGTIISMSPSSGSVKKDRRSNMY